MPTRFQTNNINAFLSDLERTWNQFNSEVPFAYHFLDEELAQLYESESRTGKMFGVFAMLAILVACIGLMGLSAFIAQQKRKEIGVRKVLGASALGIIQLLSKDFMKLILLALFIATPLAYYLMQRWLESFAYRITMSWSTFVWISLIALVLPIVVIGLQSLRSAQANPVDNLRT